MPYVFSDLSNFGALPSNCTRVGTTAIGKLQEKLKAKRYDIGSRGADCQYGDKTNEALTQYINWRVEQPPTETFTREMGREGKNYLIDLGLSAEEANSAFETIKQWILAKPSERVTPFKKVSEVVARAGTAGTAAGMGIGTAAGTTPGRPTIRLTPGSGVVSQTGPQPPKPGAGQPPAQAQLPSGEEAPIIPGPEAQAGGEAAEPWYSKYKWYLVGGSALLVLGTLGVVVATRKK